MSITKKPIDEDETEELLQRFHEPDRNTREVTGDQQKHSDADSIRRHFGIAPYDEEEYNNVALWPNIINKTWDPGKNKLAGGTDLLAVGNPGTGKSTFANHMAVREMEVPRSKVVWRASPSRSEWLPLAPWTTLLLPKDVDYTARFVPRTPGEESYSVTLEQLNDFVVRDIKRYKDPIHLNREILRPGMFHVVYPDPMMRGVQEIYEGIDEKQYDAPSDRPLFHRDDPSGHWWFGWLLSRIEHGPHDWTTLILDEIGDIAPEAARKDQFGTYQKIQLLKDSWVDARKMGVSIFIFGHSESDIHNMIRRKMRWRCSMNGSANPTSKSEVVGFQDVPMNFAGNTSRMKVGRALVWNEMHFEKIIWDDYPAPVSHKLKLERVG